MKSTAPVKAKNRLRTPPSREVITQAFEKTGGHLSATAKALGYSRESLRLWREKDPKLDNMLKDVLEGIKDNIEKCLYEKAISGDVTALIFLAKTKLRDRGYIETKEAVIGLTAKVDSASSSKNLSRLECKALLEQLEAE